MGVRALQSITLGITGGEVSRDVALLIADFAVSFYPEAFNAVIRRGQHEEDWGQAFAVIPIKDDDSDAAIVGCHEYNLPKKRGKNLVLLQQDCFVMSYAYGLHVIDEDGDLAKEVTEKIRQELKTKSFYERIFKEMPQIKLRDGVRSWIV